MEKKKELFTSYDKIIDTSATRRFKRLFKKLKIERQKDNDSDSDEEYSKIGQQIKIEIRGKLLDAEIVKTPFLKNTSIHIFLSIFFCICSLSFFYDSCC